MNKFLGIFISGLIFMACQNPITNSTHSSGRSIALSWQSGSSGARTILPATYPSATTYAVTLSYAGVPVANQTVTGTSVSFSNLDALNYTLTVNGLDANGNVITTGSANADLTNSDTAASSVILHYLNTGSGTGQIHLIFTIVGLSGVTGTVTLVDPNGIVSHPTLSGTLTLDNSAALAGSYHLFIKFGTATQFAMVSDTIVVFQNVSTDATITLSPSDFSGNPIPVTAVTLNTNSADLMVSCTTSLTSTVTGSNSFVVWNSSNPTIASVDQNGTVTALASGTATITASSVENPAISAQCIVNSVPPTAPTSVSAIHSFNGSIHQIVLTWSSVPGSASYNIYWSNSSGVTPSTGTKISNVITNSYTQTALTLGETYYYVVTAVSGAVETSASTQVNAYTYGSVSTYAGTSQGFSDGSSTSAKFSIPFGLAIDSSGNIYIADTYNYRIRKIDTAGTVTTLAGSGTNGSANGTGTAASFNTPYGVAVDGTGNVYVADFGNNLIRKISPSGIVSTFAGSGTAGSANGNGTAASFNSPAGVAVDSTGNVYVADSAGNLIRKISPAGTVTTLAGSGTSGSANGTGTAASFNTPYGVAVDSTGNVYVADLGNHLIRKITAGGQVSTFAGNLPYPGSSDGPCANATFNYPRNLTVDSQGNVFVADTDNQLIRKISVSGTVSTIAGKVGVSGFANGTGLETNFSSPAGVAVDASGSLYVAECQGNSLIRKIQ